MLFSAAAALQRQRGALDFVPRTPPDAWSATAMLGPSGICAQVKGSAFNGYVAHFLPHSFARSLSLHGLPELFGVSPVSCTCTCRWVPR